MNRSQLVCNVVKERCRVAGTARHSNGGPLKNPTLLAKRARSPRKVQDIPRSKFSTSRFNWTDLLISHPYKQCLLLLLHPLHHLPNRRLCVPEKLPVHQIQHKQERLLWTLISPRYSMSQTHSMNLTRTPGQMEYLCLYGPKSQLKTMSYSQIQPISNRRLVNSISTDRHDCISTSKIFLTTSMISFILSQACLSTRMIRLKRCHCSRQESNLAHRLCWTSCFLALI
jgi:hypothetical protein